ncbi:MAG: Rieske (2Fe-2S) domain protein [Candidatus Collierbacteria bacterium GW2011_GWC2_43_12]|uniref:Rieske (2Fe-2S) domain protein n=1 Tax=Candidatus Collierbacteria bacterium GW2011_GWC2_43_12 TaxID=1618390 RepID=A0A0G1G1G1_9BACT|nr:MAG: Rieske (2Fe-2S) domain protein [Candidatus Collierbacteria bacterium GW2011_GWC2_43_12]
MVKAKTLPGEYYTEESVLKVEKVKIFDNFWTCVGHVSSIPNAGEYFLVDWQKTNLIVLRTVKNKILAFHNSCRHRGTRLCSTQDGSLGKTIVCKYHGWNYRLDGRLNGAPGMERDDGFDFRENGLILVPVHVWEGFIFVSLAQNPPVFSKTYAPILHRFEQWKVGGLQRVFKERYLVKANWKLIIQNFSECLHCPTAHHRLNRLIKYTSSENDLAEGPFLGGFMKIINGESVTTTGRMCALPVGNLDRNNMGKGWYYSFLNNLLINKHPDYIMYHMLFPQSAGETLVVSEWLFNPDSLLMPDFRPEEAHEIWGVTNREDWHLSEISQLGIQSDGYRPGYYTASESLLAAFDEEYLRLMNK